MLAKAAEIEYCLMCTCLYAAFSFKQGIDEDLLANEWSAVKRRRAEIIAIATKEMLRLALVNNLLIAIARWRWLPIVGLTVQGLITACRAVLGAFYPNDFPAFLTPHPVNVAFAFAGNCTAMLIMIGMLMAYREEAARALERLATTDGLTGVLNRRAGLQWRTQSLQAPMSMAPH